jgi:Ca2+-binding EF-hand superfamily protein
VDQHAEDLLVHGMSRDELTELVGSIFERMDADGSGTLNKQEFVTALTSMELGLTRREINTIMFQIDQDQDNNVSYREFVPFAFDLLQKLTSLRLLETELENDELAAYLMDLFKAKDTKMIGQLHADDIRDLLHQAMLGLSRIQIYTVISEAERNSDMMISYASFIPKAVGIIRSMLSFEKSIVREQANTGPEAEDRFFFALDEAFAGVEYLPLEEFMQRLEQTGMLDAKELEASENLLAAFGDETPVDEAKSQIWSLLKSLRRHRG